MAPERYAVGCILNEGLQILGEQLDILCPEGRTIGDGDQVRGFLGGAADARAAGNDETNA
jgi:hypothetical protein